MPGQALCYPPRPKGAGGAQLLLPSLLFSAFFFFLKNHYSPLCACNTLGPVQTVCPALA